MDNNKEDLKRVVLDLDILKEEFVRLKFDGVGEFDIPLYPPMAGLIFLEDQDKKLRAEKSLAKQVDILSDTLIYIINTGSKKHDEKKLKEAIIKNANLKIIRTIIGTYYKQATDFFLSDIYQSKPQRETLEKEKQE